jgi:obg-like ATPase 1
VPSLLPLQVLAWLEDGKDVRLGDWTAREIEILNNWLLLTAKPAVYLVNCSKKDFIRKKNKFLPKIFEWVQANGGAPIIPFSGVFENEVHAL